MTKFQLAMFMVQLLGGSLLLVGTLFPRRKPAQSRVNELWAGCLCLLSAGFWWYGYNHYYSIRSSIEFFVSFTLFKYTLDGVAIAFLMKILRGGRKGSVATESVPENVR